MDYHQLEAVTREVALRDSVFKAKPTMAARDVGILSLIENANYDLDVFEAASAVVRRTLIPEERPRWDKFWADQEDVPVPVTIEELLQLCNRLVEVATGRPTQSPAPSGNGDGPTSTSSTGDSGLPAETALRIST